MTGEVPLVSVVIPSYNHAHLIARAIASVLAQSWSQLEILVIDNHSSDKTDQVVAGFADTRVRMLKVHNGGVIAISRNLGISAARGEWVAFLDSDDWWHPEKLKRCAQHFGEADFIYHRLRIVTQGRRSLLPRHVGSWPLRTPVFQYLLTDGNPVATSSVVVRRAIMEQIGGFDERREIIAAEDYDAWIRIASLTDRFLFVRECLGYYLFSRHSASRKDMSLPMREVYAVHAHRLPGHTQKRMEANAAYAAGRYAWSQGDFVKAKMELSRALSWGRVGLRMRSLVTLSMLSFQRGYRTVKRKVDPQR